LQAKTILSKAKQVELSLIYAVKETSEQIALIECSCKINSQREMDLINISKRILGEKIFFK